MIMKKQIDGAVFRKLMTTNLVKTLPAFSVRWVLPPEVYQEYECSAKIMKITVLWYVTPCSLAEIQQPIGEICCPPPVVVRITDHCLILAQETKCYTLPVCAWDNL